MVDNTNPISFGIYKFSKPKVYGEYTKGIYKGYNIEIYDAYKDKQKLIYVSDSVGRWIKSKLTYFINGVKKITRSENNGLQK